MIEMAGPLIERMRYHSEPYIRVRILVDVLGKPADAKDARILRDEVRDTVLVRTLLAEQDAAGEIPLHPYAKWRGAHWVLTSLADLRYAPGDRRLVPLREQVYAWLLSDDHARKIDKRVVDGRVRWHASMEGNAVYYLLTLGLADERTEQLVQRLLSWESASCPPPAGCPCWECGSTEGLAPERQHSGDRRCCRATSHVPLARRARELAC